MRLSLPTKEDIIKLITINTHVRNISIDNEPLIKVLNIESNRIAELESELYDLRDLEDQTSDIEDLEEENKYLEKEMYQINEENSHLEEEMHKLNKTNKELEEKVKKLEEKIEKQRTGK